MGKRDVISWLMQERAELLSMLLRMRERRALGLSFDTLREEYKARKTDFAQMNQWVSSVVEKATSEEAST